jgi:hypothetical protein
VVIVRGVLSALRHAHGLGIVHRDDKPANIMLVDDAGTGLIVKLLDFGLAKISGESESDAPLTQAGMVFGTPGYLSPEQAAGYAADARSDIYAVGIVLYELVAGRRPFLRADPIDVVRDHLNTLPPPPRTFGAQISTELERVILRALAKEPRGRFQTAEELSAALAEVPELRGPAATATPAPAAAPSPAPAAAPEEGARQTVPLKTPATPTPKLATTTPAASTPAAATPASTAPAATPSSPPAATPTPPALAPATTGTTKLQIDRRLVIAGGVTLAALLLVVVLVLVLRKPPAPIVIAPPPPPPPTVPSPPVANEAGRRHLMQALAYQRKLWCSDAIEELERAMHEDPGLRDEPAVTRVAISCLTPKTREKATRFLVERVGENARGALEEAARADANGEVRRGAALALERLR